jgi:hypothetical protein
MPGPVLDHRLFTEGVARPVCLDAAGTQDVVGPEGERVPGVWVLPPEVPSDPSAVLTATARRGPCGSPWPWGS